MHRILLASRWSYFSLQKRNLLIYCYYVKQNVSSIYCIFRNEQSIARCSILAVTEHRLFTFNNFCWKYNGKSRPVQLFSMRFPSKLLFTCGTRLFHGSKYVSESSLRFTHSFTLRFATYSNVLTQASSGTVRRTSMRLGIRDGSPLLIYWSKAV